ncbi:hypothetical protein AK830_g10540 [Neonectria ditissima]|uniref:Uncharacterized protein n=1 Tax=Neonectria ditissima TaxID=78410 RepID=A0A0P7B3D8_9HYPO|nr:hypothetical protein AK830_g10540 [Neonectria ditissima]
MASMRKSFFLASSWDIRPDEVTIGSVVANPKMPQRALSAATLTANIDTPVSEPSKETSCSGTAKKGTEWSAGLFATFLQTITLGVELSMSSDSTVQVDYSCDSIETRRFTPSLAYITKAAQDKAVKGHLKMGGLGAKVFMVTGVKTASNITITTIQNRKNEKSLKFGMDVPAAHLSVGPRGSHESTEHDEHTRTIAGPILFAYEVEKIRINLKGKVRHGEYVDGAMLARNNIATTDFVIERAGCDLDECEMDDLDVTIRSGIDEETNESCIIIIP